MKIMNYEYVGTIIFIIIHLYLSFINFNSNYKLNNINNFKIIRMIIGNLLRIRVSYIIILKYVCTMKTTCMI